jgi:hypothetical protein
MYAKRKYRFIFNFKFATYAPKEDSLNLNSALALCEYEHDRIFCTLGNEMLQTRSVMSYLYT